MATEKEPRIKQISINLLVVHRESVNLIGYITVDYKLIAHGKIVAHMIVNMTLFQTWISTHGMNGMLRLNLMKYNETVLFYALLDFFYSFMQWDYELIYTITIIRLLALVFYER